MIYKEPLFPVDSLQLPVTLLQFCWKCIHLFFFLAWIFYVSSAETYVLSPKTCVFSAETHVLSAEIKKFFHSKNFFSRALRFIRLELSQPWLPGNLVQILLFSSAILSNPSLFAVFPEKSSWKILPFRKVGVPLHSLSGSGRGCGSGGIFLPAFPEVLKLDLWQTANRTRQAARTHIIIYIYVWMRTSIEVIPLHRRRNINEQWSRKAWPVRRN